MTRNTWGANAFRILACALSVFALDALAADLASSAWQDRPGRAMPVGIDAPDAYRSLDLDVASLQSVLARHGGGVGLTVSLPSPDGKQIEFMLSDSGVMPAELAARYPRIRSYLGIDSQGRHARIDISPLGLNAMVFDREGAWLLRPVSYGQGTDYVSFRRSDAASGAPAFICGTAEIRLPDIFGLPSINTTTGTTKRNYRAAVAANHNYVTAISGSSTPTVESGLAAVVLAVNRVNEVYENNLAIHLTLVANNDLLIFPDAGTDPYQNGTGAINQNTGIINGLIGNANYDIGHVFTTGSGGVAGLGVVCNTNQKGRGTTGLSNPASLQSDIFYIDYVAHEMGHQFGGNHTFNNSCSGNRASSAAYEPGSGSTIMAYAGICSPNLQSHSDPYFHAESLREIGNFTNASGGSCSVNEPNHPAVTIAALSNYIIPASTPFYLGGSASNAAPGSSLTFGWEQYDLGAATSGGSLANDPGNGPIIRSLNPTASPIRTIPNFENLLSGATMEGEILPTTTRSLTFRLTVFDNVAVAGTTQSADSLLQVDAASGPFAVTAPAASAVWDPSISATETVTWNVANTDLAPVSCSAVDIDIHTGGRFSASTAVLATSVPNNGSALVAVPNVQSTTARVRVRCAGNIFFAMSPGNFTIIGPDLIFENNFD
ncbi:MAG: reprolysin-like metallopeptidase [Dokdonella sp.]|uniref:reprolysin-like metallopeptidase n=1 Tax=Dokdonella sp. TaxID=2291710 RepID=UPI002B60C268|nr:hypothetical protein [Xanthomonadales bacterium]HQW75419.1 M12 family metallo-peptidase [Dokdonella sp.]MBL0223097.1 hypothetical protein [Xanthomonadales bacterium]HQX66565.1 M12 family metallo-peptidase [Dokdonella sp.]HQY55149.1 M12 family metallo-peptidase [Dokdonella sp.]